MSNKHRTAQHPNIAPDPRSKADEHAEMNLAEIVLLWPKLATALARDTAGPSAEHKSSSGGPVHSPAPVNLEVHLAAVTIEHEVDLLYAEACAVVDRTPWKAPKPPKPPARLAGPLHDDGPLHDVRCGDVSCDELRESRRPFTPPTPPDPVLEQLADYGIVREQIARRDDNRSLIAAFDKRLHSALTAARRAVMLNRPPVPLGVDYVCPFHPETPAGLVIDGDIGTVNVDMLFGRDRPKGEPAWRWEHQDTIRCPQCGCKWKGPFQMAVLGKMLDGAKKAKVEARAAAIKVPTGWLRFRAGDNLTPEFLPAYKCERRYKSTALEWPDLDSDDESIRFNRVRVPGVPGAYGHLVACAAPAPGGFAVYEVTM